MSLRLDPTDRGRLRRCYWIAFVAAPAAPALIAFSIVAVADKLGYHDKALFAELTFLGNWCLAPPLAAAAMSRLHPAPQGRAWRALLAFAVAIPAYWLAFAAFAIAGLNVGLDM